MNVFLGIIATGIGAFSNFVDYRRTNFIFGHPSIVKGMSRNRFEQLCGRLYFNDKSLAPEHGNNGYDGLYNVGQSLIQFVKK